MSSSPKVPEITPQSQLPKPRRTGGAGAWLFCLLILTLGGLGGGIWWYLNEQETAQSNMIAESTPAPTLPETPPAPQPLPEETVPSEDPAPEESVAEETPSAEDVETQTSQEEAAKMVRPAFVEDLAQWMVRCYRPQNKSAPTIFTPMSANLRYGAKLQSFKFPGEDLFNNRAALLRHAFRAPVLERLYTLHGDSFIPALKDAAKKAKPPLSEAQTQDMLRVYGTQLASLAQGIQGVLQLPNLRQRLRTLEDMSQSTLAINALVAEKVFQLDTARENKNLIMESAVQKEIDILAAQYRRSVQGRESAEQELVRDIRKTAGQRLNAATILFLARWIDRRMQRTPENAIAAARQGEDILQQISAKMLQEAQ